MLCGRAGGQIVGGVFVRDEAQPPPRTARDLMRCGSCDGNLYLDAEAAVSPGVARTMVEHEPS
jgi:hypothetical protein